MTGIRIAPLRASPDIRDALRALLVEAVAGGGSVSFLHPLAPEAASGFWDRSLAAAERGERIVLGAFEGDALLGTVTLVLDMPENQLHRAEIAKMMTLPTARGRGIASALMREAERLAGEHGRRLLVLDTAVVDGASVFYETLGFTLAGEIPDYALTPHGVMSGTRLYWKRIGAAGPA